MKKKSIQLDDLSANMQDYLEAVTVLKRKNGAVRVRDLSEELQVKRSSVTEALNVLSQRGLIIHERYGSVDVTPQGEILAEKVYQRHQTLARFIQEILGVDEKTASEDACRMEHTISPKTFERFYQLIGFLDEQPTRQKPKWLIKFKEYCQLQEISNQKKDKRK